MPAAHHHLDDETLNAVLDGEATSDQRADAARCPECAARLARLGQVATELGAPVSPSDPDRRRAALDAALAAHDAGVTAPSSLDVRRRRLSSGWAAAAAVVLAGALAVPLVDGLGGNDQGREAATAGDRESTAAGGSVAEDGSLADQDAMPEASPAPPHLGEIDLAGLEELAASIARGVPQPLSSDPGPAPAASRTEADAGALEQSCEPAARRRDPSLQRLVYAGEGTVTGRPAVVLGFAVAPAGAPPSVRVLVLASDDCTELGSAAT